MCTFRGGTLPILRLAIIFPVWIFMNVLPGKEHLKNKKKFIYVLIFYNLKDTRCLIDL